MNIPSSKFAIFPLLALLATSTFVHAATVTWDGGGDMNWTQPDTTSWSTGTYNSGDNAQFLGAGAGTVTIGAGGVTPGTVTVNSSTNYNFTGSAIGGSATISKAGAGLLTLSSSNTYTGVTTVSGGTLVVEHANALGSTAGGTTMDAASTLRLQGGITVTGETLTASGAGNRALESGTGAGNTWAGNIAISGVRMDLIGYTTSLAVGSSSSDTITGSATALFLRGSGTINSTIDASASQILVGDTSNPGGFWTINSTDNSTAAQLTISRGTVSFGNIANSGTNSSIGRGVNIVLGSNSNGFGGTGGTGILQFTGVSGGSSDRRITINNGNLGGKGVIENTVAGQTLTLSGTVMTQSTGSAATLELTGAGNGVLSGSITSADNLSLTKSGNGTWTLSDADKTYGGTTTVSAGTLLVSGGLTATSGIVINGGTLQLGASNVLNDAATTTLSGGSLSTGATTGFSETLGTLDINSTVTLALGTGVHSLTFANSSAIDWTGATLTITGWTGAPNSSGTEGKIFFGNDASGLTSTQLSQINFSGYGSGAMILSTGEIVAVPEPSTLGLLAAGLTVGLTFARRRFR